jgi:hypothetical protein
MKNIIILFSMILCPFMSIYAQPGYDIEFDSNRIFVNSTQYLTAKVNNKYFDEISRDFAFWVKYEKLFKVSREAFEWTILNLPAKATFNETTREFRWKPTAKDVGEYNVTFIVKYKDVTDTMNFRITVSDEWSSAFIPGVALSLYYPSDNKNLSIFKGAAVNYLLYSWIHRNENRGPSHGNLYAKLDVLTSDIEGTDNIFLYNMGLLLSFERNASRDFLVPFFGLEIGGMLQKKISNIFIFTPIVGAWIYTDPNLNIGINAGYLMPTNHFDEYKGLRANLNVNFSMW